MFLLRGWDSRMSHCLSKDGDQVRRRLPGVLRHISKEGELDQLRHLRAVGRAAALALAAVLGFAAVVARLAATLSLAVVLAFTGVLRWLVGIGVTETDLGGFYRGCGLRGGLRLRSYRGSAD